MEKAHKILLRAKVALGKTGAFIWQGVCVTCRWTWDALKWLGLVIWRATKATGRSLGKAINWLFRFLGKIIDDLLAIAGAGFISYGVYIIYRPAGFITLGVLLVAGACVVAQFKGRR